ncbi:restriction endonuclease [Bacillus sp. BGMRC 2118]|nr:restriction endonuclease [Bacillus sp. BGMRC 2118]
MNAIFCADDRQYSGLWCRSYSTKERLENNNSSKKIPFNVGIKAVQEVIGAINYYKASVGWDVTNSFLTMNAKKLAESNKVKIIERKELIELGLKIKIKLS